MDKQKNNICIEDLPPNDNVNQLYHSVDRERHLEPEEYQKEKDKMTNCKHLLVILSGMQFYTGKGNLYNGYAVECCKCGITNKYVDLIRTLNRPGREISKLPLSMECFKEWNKSNQDYLSDEMLNSYHIGILYRVALKLKPYGTREEIFNLMKELHNMETTQEKLRISSEEHTIDLVKRYKEKKLAKKISLKQPRIIC